jgi:hypothetical protein
MDWKKEEDAYLKKIGWKKRGAMTDYEFAKNVKMNHIVTTLLEAELLKMCEGSKHKMGICRKCLEELPPILN